MPKSKSQTSSKQHSTLKLSRAALRKEDDRRFQQLVETSREHGRMASEFAKLAGWTPDKIPASLLREMRDAAKRARKPMPKTNFRRAR